MLPGFTSRIGRRRIVKMPKAPHVKLFNYYKKQKSAENRLRFWKKCAILINVND